MAPSLRFAFQDEPFDFKIRTTVLTLKFLNGQTQIPRCGQDIGYF